MLAIFLTCFWLLVEIAFYFSILSLGKCTRDELSFSLIGLIDDAVHQTIEGGIER
jgi:hypothetical protein